MCVDLTRAYKSAGVMSVSIEFPSKGAGAAREVYALRARASIAVIESFIARSSADVGQYKTLDLNGNEENQVGLECMIL